MNRAFDLDTVYIKFVNWLSWEQAQSKFTKHFDWDRGKKDALADLGEDRTDFETTDQDEFGRADESELEQKVEEEEKEEEPEEEEEAEDEYGDYYGEGYYGEDYYAEETKDEDAVPENEYYDGYYDDEGAWVENDHTGEGEATEEQEDEEYYNQEEEIEEDLELSEDDNEYGDLIEESLKEFSMSLTAEQLE